MATDKHEYKDIITDLHIKLPGKSHQDPLEVNVDGSEENASYPYRRMFPDNLTNDLPKPHAFQPGNTLS